MILKVSAGDVISAASNYFYFTNDATGPSINTSDVLTPLIGALLAGKGSAVTKVNGSSIQTNLSVPAGDFASFIGNQVNNGSPTAPKAFLNILFFDEQFNFIPLDPNTPSIGTNLQRVSQANDQSADPLLLTQKAPKNGWVYIYLSNESNQSVYFDNLQVSQEHGRIAEENHYYAFGQKIAGICTKAFNKLPPNSFNYQGDYSEEEENTLWNEFDLRMYDPQIGRWTGADPYDQFSSPYIGMGNDPVNSVDPDGGGVDGPGPSWAAGVAQDMWTNFMLPHGYCDKCLGETLDEAVVTAKVPIGEYLKITVTEQAQMVGGVFKGAAISVLNTLKDAVAQGAPNPVARLELLSAFYSPEEALKRYNSDPIKNLDQMFNYGDMLFDPSGKRQKAFFTELYNNFKYASPGERGEKLGHLAPAIVLTFVGQPEMAAETDAGFMTGAFEAVETGGEVNRIYSARELIRRGEEPGPFHNFPESFNKIIFENGTKTVTPNYFKVAKPNLSNTNILYRQPGAINGTRGVFEIGVRPSVSGRTELIMHRFFNPTR